MLQQSAPSSSTSIDQHVAYIAGEARQLFQKRVVTYGVLAAVIAGVTLFVAGANQVHFQQVSPTTNAAHDEMTPEKGGSMSNTQPSGNAQQSSNISVETQSSSSSNTTSHSDSQVIVNGQQIAIPDNGTAHTTVEGSGGSASVSVTHQTSSDGGGSHASLHVEVNAGGDSGAGGE